MLLNCGVGEDSWESLDCKEIKLVNPKGNQPWIFTWRTDVEAEAPILWPRDAKSWLIGKDPDAGNDWRLEENGATEDEMVGWYHQLDGLEFEQAPGVGDGWGSLVCFPCSPWAHKESDMTEWLNCTELRNPLLEWVAISSSRGSSQPRDQTYVSCIGRWILYHWVLVGKFWIFLFSDPSDTLCFFLFPHALQRFLHGTWDCWQLIPFCSYFQVPGEISSLNCHCLM